jgi:hypothetical protein
VLGWTAADRVVLLVPDPEPAPDSWVDPVRHWVTEVPLDGEPERLAAVPTGGGNYGVSRFQLAGGLLSDVEVREPGPVDRGPWPLWLRLAAAVALAAVCAAVAPALARRKGAPPEPPGTPGPTSDGPSRSTAETVVRV